MKQPDAVVAGVARALRPDGRFVGELGGAGNTATVFAALQASLHKRGVDPGPLNPWYFPSVEEYRGKLERGGFQVDTIFLFDRPTELPGPLTDWLETFTEPFTAALPASERNAFREEVQEATRGKLLHADDKWRVDYVRLRFATHLRPAR
jgi:SAM-dependent methyltransferase